MKETILTVLQAVLAVFLIILVVLQQKGSGLSQVFGGSSNVYATRRGLDKILHYATIVGGVLFFASALLRLIV